MTLAHKSKINGVKLIYLDRPKDSRGYFQKNWSVESFRKLKIKVKWDHTAFAMNPQRLTLRGLHYQIKPYQEAKLVQCLQGKAFDVVVDIRPKSPTFGQYESYILSAEDPVALYIPEGMAHGYLTLKKNTLFLYHLSKPYHQKSCKGLRWDDPVFKIQWPHRKNLIISERDQSFKYFSE